MFMETHCVVWPTPPQPCHSSEEPYSETREPLEPELMVLKEIV